MNALAQGLSVSSAPFWVWWAVPVAVTALVVAGVALAMRRERPRDGLDAVDDYARFREAMAQVRESTRRSE